MARNIVIELNLAVGKINCVSPNFIPPTFNTCNKSSIIVTLPNLILNQTIFNNTAYSTLLPNIITANISGYRIAGFDCEKIFLLILRILSC